MLAIAPEKPSSFQCQYLHTHPRDGRAKCLDPLIFSIANGLAFGLTAYALIKLVRGKIAWTDWLLLVISALSVVRFVWLSAG